MTSWGEEFEFDSLGFPDEILCIDDVQITNHDDQVIICGFLLKSSGREKGKAKGFQKRWFVLSESSISYYKNEKDNKPLKQISTNSILSVSHADTTTKKEFSFQLKTLCRTFYLVANTEKDRNLWINQIQQQISSNEQTISESESDDLFTVSESLSEDTHTLKEQEQEEIGFVYKLGGKKKDIARRASNNWQKRWLVLRKDKLLYYKKATDTKEAGNIPLNEITSILADADTFTHKQYSFRISVTNRDYYFYTESASQSTQYAEKIRNSLPGLLRPPVATTVSVEVSIRNDIIEEEGRASLNEDSFSISDFETKRKQGFLWKTPGTKKKPGNWQKRWFIIQGNLLLYYKHAKDLKEAGKIKICDILKVEQLQDMKNAQEYRFDVHTEGRIYFLFADSFDCRTDWIACIRAGVKEFSMRDSFIVQ